MARNDQKLLTAQEFINVEAIEGGILWTKNKYLYAYIQCRGRDNSLLSETDNEKVTEVLTMALSEQTEAMQILSIPRTVDTRGMIRELSALRSSTDNDIRLKLLSGEINALEELAEEGAKEPLIILKIWLPAQRDADRKLLERATLLKNKLEENQIAAKLLNDREILHLCTIYAELGIWQPADDVRSDIPCLKGKKRLWSRDESPQEKAYNELMEQITPVGGLFFQANGFELGASFCRCYGVTRYPADIDYGWAVKLVNSTDCITCITYYPGNAGELGDALSRSVRTSMRDATEQNDTRAKKKYERKARDADRLIDDLDAKGKALGHISVTVMPWAETKEELEKVCQEVNSRFAIKHLKLKLLSCIQKEAFQQMSPYYPNQAFVDDITRRIIPLETVIGGYPFTVNTLRDDHGVYFARTPDRGIVSLDIRYRGGDRNNGGGILAGDPGVGKSTTVKHMIESAYMQGIFTFVFDPEREYMELCQNLGGAWFDAGGGAAKVNLLEPLDCAGEDLPEDVPGGAQPLAMHIQQIQDIFQAKIPSLTDLQIALLKRAMIKLYAYWGIPLDVPAEKIRSMAHTQWPVIRDLYELLRREQQTDPRCEEVATLIEDMAIGADAMVWNGHTNIDMDNNLIVVDLNKLYSSSDQNKRAQYFNLMRLAFNKVTADRTTPCFVIADESQIMVDPEMPQTAKQMLNMALRSRKYEGYLWLVLHSVHEFLHEKVRRYGQPILDSATYKILFGTSGQNLIDTVSLFRLTPAEEKALEARQRGKAIAIIGSRHLKIEFELPKYKLELMGSGGGR